MTEWTEKTQTETEMFNSKPLSYWNKSRSLHFSNVMLV